MITNIFDYLVWRGDLALECSECNEVDGVILARLSYLPFEKVMEQRSVNTMKLASAAESFLELPDLESAVLMKEDVRLLAFLAESPRFQNMELLMYVNQIEAETQTQFSAITVKLNRDYYFIAFRGTDNTLIGWKEDFNMSFVCPVPAQKLALHYVETIAHSVSGKFIIGGHSKGGNLAVYASACCSHDIQERIEKVYNYDGPGFDEKILLTDGYQKICQRVNTFVPQSSIVGMLLGHEEEYTIVHSAQVSGIWQHDIYSWEVRRHQFVCLESVNNSSRFIDYTLKAWVADLDYAQRELFIDTIYTVISETNAATIHELGDNWFASAKTVLKTVKNLDEETRRAVTQTLLLLAKSAKTGMFQMFQR